MCCFGKHVILQMFVYTLSTSITPDFSIISLYSGLKFVTSSKMNAVRVFTRWFVGGERERERERARSHLVKHPYGVVYLRNRI